jgi:uncharacterized membrane protein YphA (DoxX/SURF4 family)
MKSLKITYWITTSIVCLFAATAINFNSQMAIDGAKHVLIPDYLRLEVSFGQIIGCLLLIIPQVPARFKEWAYVGFGIMYLTAINAHINVGDPVSNAAMAAIFFCILLVSYISFHKLQAAKNQQ